MINNRQNGRRRGRGGQRPPNASPSPGNRQDNRSRGNAAQLYEKYKAMARDMQLAGDRVQTEYYLQFADHYFRVLNENRSRFEEPRRQSRDDYMSDEDEDQDQDQDEGVSAEAEQPRRFEREAREHREPREQREFREPREQREFREPREQREPREPREDREDQQEQAAQPREHRDGGERRPRRERPRRERNGEAERGSEAQDGGGEERISLEALPPPIAPIDIADAPAKAVRRRTRRPRPDGDEAEIAPAA